MVEQIEQVQNQEEEEYLQPNGDDYQSKLSKHAYWESNFEMELKNFEDHEDEGEIWFGKDVQKKTVAFVLERFREADQELEESTKQLKLLDVGTGNGMLLFKLAKKGFAGLLKGVDYSQQSIALARKIQETNHSERSNIEFEFQNAFDHLDEGVYDIIHDKGTFDVVHMNDELSNEDYARAMHFRLSRQNPKAIFIVTSCNRTSKELDEVFAIPGCFKLLTEIKGYKQFKFGGVTGQVVSTNVYQL